MFFNLLWFVLFLIFIGIMWILFFFISCVFDLINVGLEVDFLLVKMMSICLVLSWVFGFWKIFKVFCSVLLIWGLFVCFGKFLMYFWSFSMFLKDEFLSCSVVFVVVLYMSILYWMFLLLYLKLFMIFLIVVFMSVNVVLVFLEFVLSVNMSFSLGNEGEIFE